MAITMAKLCSMVASTQIVVLRSGNLRSRR
jgi:hypothetical protein